ncbi:MarR family transcriptional regulator [Bacillus sp. WLY-B-L8]|uniref:MarR family transcriptional regulator n=1 Tax=Bacillus multifaciens TaxID=3068506 RepID=UPI0027428286|nr:MarR family transcriptional regulator [Bacillus sp. WLY-B-L8]MDP7981091.1 MarR family transcriptional regulator [Bacillus sp. WLY-B-L8]
MQALIHKKEEYMKEVHEQFLSEIGISDISLSELHVIACIGQQGLMNVTAITERMGMTKGAISKICTKLFNKNFVEKMKMLNNQKEIFFRLTDKGREIYHAHETLHNKAEEAWLSFLDKYTKEELVVIQQFIADVTEHIGTKGR